MTKQIPNQTKNAKPKDVVVKSNDPRSSLQQVFNYDVNPPVYLLPDLWIGKYRQGGDLLLPLQKRRGDRLQLYPQSVRARLSRLLPHRHFERRGNRIRKWRRKMLMRDMRLSSHRLNHNNNLLLPLEYLRIVLLH